MKSKMKLMAAIRIWVVIYPSITFFLYYFGAPLAALPLYQRTFLLTITLVPWMVFAGLPLLDTLVRNLTKAKSSKPVAGQSLFNQPKQ